MVSGTIAHRRKAEEKRAENIRKIKEAVEKTKALDANREQVIAEVCALFGWKELDPFAKEMIDKALAGQMVDIEQLKNDIATWKQAREVSERATEMEDSDNGNI